MNTCDNGMKQLGWLVVIDGKPTDFCLFFNVKRKVESKREGTITVITNTDWPTPHLQHHSSGHT